MITKLMNFQRVCDPTGGYPVPDRQPHNDGESPVFGMKNPDYKPDAGHCGGPDSVLIPGITQDEAAQKYGYPKSFFNKRTQEQILLDIEKVVLEIRDGSVNELTQTLTHERDSALELLNLEKEVVKTGHKYADYLSDQNSILNSENLGLKEEVASLKFMISQKDQDMVAMKHDRDDWQKLYHELRNKHL